MTDGETLLHQETADHGKAMTIKRIRFGAHQRNTEAFFQSGFETPYRLVEGRRMLYLFKINLPVFVVQGRIFLPGAEPLLKVQIANVVPP